MTTHETTRRASWLPLVLVALTSLTTVINLTVLQTGIGTIVDALDVSVATVQLAIVAYAVVVAAFTITGGRLNSVFGPLPAQAIALGCYAAGMFLSARGVAMFTVSALGTAISGALLLFALVGVADGMILDHPELSLPETVALDTTTVDFVSNDHLRAVLSASPYEPRPEQVEAAVEINIAARLQALQISLGGLALIALASVISTRFLTDEDENT